jgi:hypothetical protein
MFRTERPLQSAALSKGEGVGERGREGGVVVEIEWEPPS